MSANKDNPGCRLAVKVTPNAGRSEITGFKEKVLQVRVAAPPDKGKANKELTDFLAERLKIKKSAISIIRGQSSRHKTVFIEGLNEQELLKRLE